MGYYLILGRRERTSDTDILGSFKIAQSVNDQMAQPQLDIQDVGCANPVNIGDEVLLIDTTTTHPTHNLIRNPYFFSPLGTTSINQPAPFNNSSGYYTLTEPSGTSITTGTDPYGTSEAIMTTSNALTGCVLSQWTQPNLVVGSMQYCLSMYLYAISTLVNAYVVIEMDYYNSTAQPTLGPGGGGSSGGFLGRTQQVITPTGTQARYSITDTAPEGTAYIAVYVSLIPSNSSNSGSVSVEDLQLEPVWFSEYQQTYPTPFCGQYGSGCYMLPDSTTIRQNRLFAGRVSHTEPVYDGPDRIWTTTCQSLQYLLEMTTLNTTYSAELDYNIIADLCNNWLGGLITYNNAVAAVTLDRSYDDQYLSEVMTDLCNTSGFSYYVDYYFDLHYGPLGGVYAPFRISDNPSEIDNATVYGYKQWQNPHDGTQLGNHIIVKGGPFTITTTDTFVGDGTTTTFTLTQVKPLQVISCTVAGTEQKKGINGDASTTFAGGYQVLVDFPNHKIVFGTAPGNTITVLCEYTADSQIRSELWELLSYGRYKRFYDRVVNDTTLVTTAAAQARGQQELAQYAFEMQTPKFRLVGITPTAGQTIEISNALEGLVKAPYLVLKVTTTLKPSGTNLYDIECGADIPTFHRLMKHLHKGLTRSQKLSGGVASSINLVVVEPVKTGIDDGVTGTVVTGTSTYGTAIYGSSTYN